MRSKPHALPITAAVLLTASVASAQTNPYRLSHTIDGFRPISGGNTHTPIAYAFGYDAWDEGAAEILLPFPFTWFGETKSTIWVYTNGFVAFAPPPPAGGILGPSGAVPNPGGRVHDLVAPMWADLSGADPGGAITGEIRSVVGGSAPNRTFTIQVTGLKRAQNPTSEAAFQIVLEETTAGLTIVYGRNTGIGGATAGFENATGQQGGNLTASFAGCQQCACLPRTCGSINFPEGLSIRLELPLEAELIGAVEGPRGAYPGTGFLARYRVANLGQRATGPFEAELRLSGDTTIDLNDTLLATVRFPAGLAVATASTATIALTMPSGIPVARYFLGIGVDSTAAVPETLENNNTAYDPGGIVSGPDLVIGALSAPLASGPGEPMDVVLELRSAGAPVVDPVDVSFYLSTDASLDPADVLLATRSFVLPDGFGLQQTVTLQIPPNVQPSPPSYRVIAVVDPSDAIDETTEGNNVGLAPQSITLSAPDLEVRELRAPGFAFRNLPFAVEATVRNLGGTMARNFQVCALISSNQLISVINDPILARTSTLSLDAGGTLRIRLEPVVPATTATGAWYVAMVADCESSVTENVETNNVARTADPITIRDPAPNLVPVAIETSSAAAAGESIALSVIVGNYGNRPARADLTVVVSDNPGPTLMDRPIWSSSSPMDLGPNEEVALSAWASLPGDLPSGLYYFGVIVDPMDLVDEVLEDDNSLATRAVPVAGAELAVVSPDPPPAVIGVPYTWRFSALGGAEAYTWSIAWTDAAPAGLSFDPALGELSGSPAASAEGTHELTVSVRSGRAEASAKFLLRISSPTLPLSVVSAKLPPALAGEGYSVRLLAVGGVPPYEWALGPSSALPPGIRLSERGVLGGEPATVGAFTFDALVVDSTGAFATGVIAFDVIDPSSGVTISTADIPRGTVGEAYSVRFEVIGGDGPYTWRTLAAPIPGIRFMGGDQPQLVGTATIAGRFPVQIEVRDANGLLDRNAYVLEIFERGELAILTDGGALPKGKVGVDYADVDLSPIVLRAGRRGGGDAPPGIVWSIADGALPDGLSLGASDGFLRGTPTTVGVWAFVVLVRDGGGDFDRATFAIEVEPAPAAPGAGGGDEGCSCATAPRSDGGGLGLGLLLLLGLVLRPRRWLRRAARPVALGLAVALSGLAAGRASAQTPYQVISEPAPYQRLSGGTRIDPGLGDGSVFRLELPFDVMLYGQRYSVLWINANGFVSVTQTSPGHHFPATANPSTSSPNGYVAPLWGDWCSSFGGACVNPPTASPEAGVYYAIDGTFGSERVTIEWREVRHFQDDLSPTSLTFSVTMYGGSSGQIDLAYGPMLPGRNFNNDPVTLRSRVGIEAEGGREGRWLGPCVGSDPCTTPEVQSLADTRIRILIDAGADVQIGSVSVPEQAYPGLPLPVTARYLSRHRNPLGPTVVDVLLLPLGATSTAGAVRVGRTAPLTLAPYESRLLSLAPVLPDTLPEGRYEVALVADALHQLAETDETNNLAFASRGVRIAGRGPDFRVERLRPQRGSVAPGDTVPVEWTLSNAGNEPGRASLAFVLSANDAITPEDTRLGPSLSFDLPARSSTSGVARLPIPGDARTGLVWVGAVADPDALVVELDETNNVARAAQALEVSAGAVMILTDSLPPATLTRFYQGRVRAIGGNGQFVWRLTRGTLPRGVIFDADQAEITGIPLEAGRFELELEARSGGVFARSPVVFTVLDPQVPLTILTRSLPPAIVGSQYALTPQAVGGVAPLRWTALGELPAGMVVATDGTILGVPEASGLARFGLQVQDAGAATATVGLELEIRLPSNLSVISSELGDAEVGMPFAANLAARGGVSPYRWRALTALPPGLQLGEDGLLSGIPEKVGSFRAVVQVQDAVASVDTNEVRLEVRPTGRLLIVLEALPPAEPGVEYRAVLRVSGGVPPYTWTVPQDAGGLPPGLEARPGLTSTADETPDDLVLAGVPGSEGIWAFVVRVEDSQGRLAERPYALLSRIPTAMPSEPAPEGGCVCAPPIRGGPGLGALALGIVALAARRRRS